MKIVSSFCACFLDVKHVAGAVRSAGIYGGLEIGSDP